MRKCISVQSGNDESLLKTIGHCKIVHKSVDDKVILLDRLTNTRRLNL